MKLDPTKLKDWQIAEAAEEFMKPVEKLAGELGILPDEIIPMDVSLRRLTIIRCFIVSEIGPRQNIST